MSSWQGVCPKLLMMPSRALRCVSSVMASRSTAPAGGDGHAHGGDTHPPPSAPHLTLVGAVVEDVEGLHGGRAALFVPEDEVDPLVEVGRDVFRLLSEDGLSGRAGKGLGAPPGLKGFPNAPRAPPGLKGLPHLTRALRCCWMKSSRERAHRGRTTSPTFSLESCRQPRSKPAGRTRTMRDTEPSLCSPGGDGGVPYRSGSPGTPGSRRTLG